MCFKWLSTRLADLRIGKGIGKEISADDLEIWIKKITPHTVISTMDRVYRLVPLEKVARFLAYDTTDAGIYTSEFKDCDDFAVQLWGLWKSIYGKQYTSFGLVLVDTDMGPHAVNIFVDDNYDIWFLEPQSDNYWLMEEKLDWDPYLIMF